MKQNENKRTISRCCWPGWSLSSDKHHIRMPQVWFSYRYKTLFCVILCILSKTSNLTLVGHVEDLDTDMDITWHVTKTDIYWQDNLFSPHTLHIGCDLDSEWCTVNFMLNLVYGWVSSFIRAAILMQRSMNCPATSVAYACKRFRCLSIHRLQLIWPLGLCVWRPQLKKIWIKTFKRAKYSNCNISMQ